MAALADCAMEVRFYILVLFPASNAEQCNLETHEGPKIQQVAHDQFHVGSADAAM